MLKLNYAPLAGAICVATTLTLFGCGRDETAPVAADEPRVYGAAAAGAPSFNAQPSGMGFNTGDAAHADGQGSGLMGFHETGAAGTSGTITDHRIAPEQLNQTPREQR
jgi:hypothetical protein